MKQVLQALRGGAPRVADVPPPALRAGGVLVRTRWSLISAGTERMVIELAGKSLVGKARARPDHVKKTLDKIRRDGLMATYRAVTSRLSGDEPLGYSAAGEVLEVAPDVVGIKPGDGVACAGRRYATHAEILSVPRNLCARVPDGVNLRDACAATMGAIALQGVRTADMRLGEVAVVIGLGLVGQLAVQLLKASGVRVVAIDRDAGRTKLAGELGADVALVGDQDADAAVAGLTDGNGADAVLVCAASESNGPVALAARLARKRGVIVLVGKVGMELDHGTFYVKELSLRMSTSYGPGRYDPVYEEHGLDYPYPYVRWTEGRNLESFLELIGAGSVRMDPLLSHEYGIDAAEDAYGMIGGDSGEPFMGVLLRYERSVDEARRPVPAARAPGASGDVGLGIIGAGAFASAVLLPALASAPRSRLAAVVTSSGATADAVARRFEIPRVGTGPDDLIGADDVGAVIVATRHDSHASLVVAALEAGKPCFVEKPLCIRPSELDDIVAAMEARPGVVCVGFNRRFSPGVVAMKKELGGRTGPLHARYRVSAGAIPREHWTRDPAVGGGRIIGEGCHFVDLMAFVVGSSVVRVQAEALPEDGTTALLRFADGSTAVFEYVTDAAPGLAKEWLEVHWGGNSLELDDFRSVTRHGRGKPRKVWSGGQDKGHREELLAFVAACAAGGESPVPFHQALNSTRATFALLDSMASGQAVEVPE